MASAFSDRIMASGGMGWKHPAKISGTTKGMTMKLLSDDGTYKEVKNQKHVTSRHASFTKFFMIVNIDIRNRP